MRLCGCEFNGSYSSFLFIFLHSNELFAASNLQVGLSFVLLFRARFRMTIIFHVLWACLKAYKTLFLIREASIYSQNSWKRDNFPPWKAYCMKKRKHNHKSKKPPSLVPRIWTILNFFQPFFLLLLLFGVNNKQNMFAQTVITMENSLPHSRTTQFNTQLLNNYILNKMNCSMLNKKSAGAEKSERKKWRWKKAHQEQTETGWSCSMHIFIFLKKNGARISWPTHWNNFLGISIFWELLIVNYHRLHFNKLQNIFNLLNVCPIL